MNETEIKNQSISEVDREDTSRDSRSASNIYLFLLKENESRLPRSNLLSLQNKFCSEFGLLLESLFATPEKILKQEEAEELQKLVFLGFDSFSGNKIKLHLEQAMYTLEKTPSADQVANFLAQVLSVIKILSLSSEKTNFPVLKLKQFLCFGNGYLRITDFSYAETLARKASSDFSLYFSLFLPRDTQMFSLATVYFSREDETGVTLKYSLVGDDDVGYTVLGSIRDSGKDANLASSFRIKLHPTSLKSERWLSISISWNFLTGEFEVVTVDAISKGTKTISSTVCSSFGIIRSANSMRLRAVDLFEGYNGFSAVCFISRLNVKSLQAISQLELADVGMALKEKHKQELIAVLLPQHAIECEAKQTVASLSISPIAVESKNVSVFCPRNPGKCLQGLGIVSPFGSFSLLLKSWTSSNFLNELQNYLKEGTIFKIISDTIKVSKQMQIYEEANWKLVQDVLSDASRNILLSQYFKNVSFLPWIQTEDIPISNNLARTEEILVVSKYLKDPKGTEKLIEEVRASVKQIIRLFLANATLFTDLVFLADVSQIIGNSAMNRFKEVLSAFWEEIKVLEDCSSILQMLLNFICSPTSYSCSGTITTTCLVYVATTFIEIALKDGKESVQLTNLLNVNKNLKSLLFVNAIPTECDRELGKSTLTSLFKILRLIESTKPASYSKTETLPSKWFFMLPPQVLPRDTKKLSKLGYFERHNEYTVVNEFIFSLPKDSTLMIQTELYLELLCIVIQRDCSDSVVDESDKIYNLNALETMMGFYFRPNEEASCFFLNDLYVLARNEENRRSIISCRGWHIMLTNFVLSLRDEFGSEVGSFKISSTLLCDLLCECFVFSEYADGSMALNHVLVVFGVINHVANDSSKHECLLRLAILSRIYEAAIINYGNSTDSQLILENIALLLVSTLLNCYNDDSQIIDQLFMRQASDFSIQLMRKLSARFSADSEEISIEKLRESPMWAMLVLFLCCLCPTSSQICFNHLSSVAFSAVEDIPEVSMLKVFRKVLMSRSTSVEDEHDLYDGWAESVKVLNQAVFSEEHNNNPLAVAVMHLRKKSSQLLQLYFEVEVGYSEEAQAERMLHLTSCSNTARLNGGFLSAESSIQCEQEGKQSYNGLLNLRDLIVQKSSLSQVESWKLSDYEDVLGCRKLITPLFKIPSSVVQECFDKTLSEASKWLPLKQNNINRVIATDEILRAVFEKVKLYLPEATFRGTLELTDKAIYFISTSRSVCDGIWEDEKSQRCIKKEISCLKQILGFCNNLQPLSMELIFQGFEMQSLFMSFRTLKERMTFLRLLSKSELLAHRLKSENVARGKQLAHFTAAWKARKLSSFDYLMHVNRMAGRSFNNLQQYPVFPWLLLNPNDKGSLRDLSKPMGALNLERLKELEERRNSSEIPFLYSNLFSNETIVLYYLVRLSPFQERNYLLQDRKVDHLDRLFTDISKAVESSLVTSSDVKEVIPEFFFLPEMFEIQNQHTVYNTLTAVELPEWANEDAFKFVTQMKEFLESDVVSQKLHLWIDLIFGVCQTGEEARKSFNLFNPMCYEKLNESSVQSFGEDEMIALHHAKQCGQMPGQIFDKRHPERSEHTNGPLIKCFDSILLNYHSLLREGKSIDLASTAKIFDFKQLLALKESETHALSFKTFSNYFSSRLFSKTITNEGRSLPDEQFLKRPLLIETFLFNEKLHLCTISGSLKCNIFTFEDHHNSKSQGLQLISEWQLVNLSLELMISEFNSSMLCFCKESNSLYVCGFIDGTIKVFDIPSKALVTSFGRDFIADGEVITALDVQQSSHIIILGTNFGNVFKVDLITGSNINSVQQIYCRGVVGGISCIKIATFLGVIAIGEGSGHLTVVALSDCTNIRRFRLSTDPLKSIQAGENLNSLVVSDSLKTLYLVPLNRGLASSATEISDDIVDGQLVSLPGYDILLLLAASGEVQLLNLSNSEETNPKLSVQVSLQTDELDLPVFGTYLSTSPKLDDDRIHTSGMLIVGFKSGKILLLE